jgi:hypothetical protein
VKYLIIKCAFCNRAVELVEVTEAPEVPGWRIVVRCHGAREEMVLGCDEVNQIGRGAGIVDATAFRSVAMIPVSDRLRCDEEAAP